ncbi:hypothetical protein ELE36_18235 [Pseudolysobacter antarcticus]|uniref:MAPEG family protein n=1 Tax=Pseudolysobacter antarcticus TaxID=2511995 RepID=A0A411HNT2_9GAMM|nr:MAPEG family protein [Pseudolysobacter antarcticus]QBB72147.1 hypothetical protein ELE36_18235 [Pseudolysobacter antarcticus]
MQVNTILLPVFGLVLLTFVVWLQMYVVRFNAARKNKIAIDDLTPFNCNLPRAFITSGDNLRNLFELPVLFYLAAVLLLILHRDDAIYVWLAWAYFALRCLHSFIHTTYNRVSHRFAVYFLSSLVLWAIWLRLALQVLSASLSDH